MSVKGNWCRRGLFRGADDITVNGDAAPHPSVACNVCNQRACVMFSREKESAFEEVHIEAHLLRLRAVRDVPLRVRDLDATVPVVRV